MSRFVDIQIEERRPKTEDISNGKSAFKHNQVIYSNDYTIIYLIFTYNFSEFNFISCFTFYFQLTMLSVNQEDEFTEVTRVTRGRKKRKASNSPTLPSQPKPGSSEPSLGTLVCPKPSYKNTIPVIISGVDDKFENWRTDTQYHPSLKISRIKELPKDDFVIIEDLVQDVIILQNETKMKAALGQKVKVSVLKAFQTSKVQTKSLAVKGVPIANDITV